MQTVRLHGILLSRLVELFYTFGNILQRRQFVDSSLISYMLWLQLNIPDYQDKFLSVKVHIRSSGVISRCMSRSQAGRQVDRQAH
jgi:hypothetical protein